MGSDDSKPKSLMSRSKGDNKVITGGRSIKYWPRSNWGSNSPATWLSNPDKDLNPPSSPDLSEEERPKAKKPMFKHVPRVVDPKKRPLAGSAGSVEDAMDSSTTGHLRGGSGHAPPHGGWNLHAHPHGGHFSGRFPHPRISPGTHVAIAASHTVTHPTYTSNY